MPAVLEYYAACHASLPLQWLSLIISCTVTGGAQQNGAQRGNAGRRELKLTLTTYEYNGGKLKMIHSTFEISNMNVILFLHFFLPLFLFF